MATAQLDPETLPCTPPAASLPPAKQHADMTSFTLTEPVWAKGVGRSLTAFPGEEREAQRRTVACPRSHRQLVEELGL